MRTIQRGVREVPRISLEWARCNQTESICRTHAESDSESRGFHSRVTRLGCRPTSRWTAPFYLVAYRAINSGPARTLSHADVAGRRIMGPGCRKPREMEINRAPVVRTILARPVEHDACFLRPVYADRRRGGKRRRKRRERSRTRRGARLPSVTSYRDKNEILSLIRIP